MKNKIIDSFKMMIIGLYERIVFFLLKKISVQKIKSQIVRIIPMNGGDIRYIERCTNILRDIIGYEKKISNLQYPECDAARLLPPEKLFDKIKKYDIVSFDIFDTLLFRTWYGPSDIFEVMGTQLDIANFKAIRREAEKKAREKCQYPIHEVRVEEIYEEVERICGLPVETGMSLEYKLQTKYSYANPYMKKLYDILIENGKKVILVSDMYFDKEHISTLVHKNGYDKYCELFLSSDLDVCKKDGRMQKYINDSYIRNDEWIIHIGDNDISDIKMSKKNGWDTYLYNAVNTAKRGGSYRVPEMSSLGGAMYRGIVNANNWCGISDNNRYHEFGFTYIGVLVYAFCEWIDEIVCKENFDEILFCARDMQIVYDVYEKYFAHVRSRYINVSRIMSYKMDFMRNCSGLIWYLKKNIDDNPGLSIFEALCNVELGCIAEELVHYGISKNTKAQNVNFDVVERMIYDLKDRVIEHFSDERNKMSQYLKDNIQGNKKILVIDTNGRLTSYLAIKNIIHDLIDEEAIVKCALLYSVSDPGFVDANILAGNVYVMICSNVKNKDFYNKYRLAGEGRTKVIESVFTSENGTVRGVGESVFYFYDNQNVRYSIVTEQIHKGIRDFCNIYHRYNGGSNRAFKLSPIDAWTPLDSVMDNKKILDIYLDNNKVDLKLGM